MKWTIFNSIGLGKRKIWKTISAVLLVAVILASSIATGAPVLAAARTASVSGKWSSITTWGGSAIPTSTDAVTINSGVIVTVDTAAFCASLTLNAVASSNGVIISGTNSFTVMGAISFVMPGNANMTSQIDVGAGSITAGSVSDTSNNGSSRYTGFTDITTGSLIVTGNYYNSGGGTSGPRIVLAGPGTVTIGGNLTVGTFTSATGSIANFGGTVNITNFNPGTGTINYNAAESQPVAGLIYHNLILSGSGLKTMVSNTAIEGNLSINGSAKASINSGLNISVNSLTLGGSNELSGTWGSNASSATHKDSTYFDDAATGILTVISGLSNDATVTSAIYTVSTLSGGAGTITNVPSGMTKADFEAGLAKHQANQTWDDSGIADPVITGNTLVVTAQDGTTKATYTVTVNAALSSDATVTSAIYTVSTLSGGAGTITNVPSGMTKADFEAGLAKRQANQTWDDSGIADPVVTGNTLVVTAQDGTTKATYTVTVNTALSSDATVTSTTYTVSELSGGAGTITNVPGGTTKADFEAGLAKHQASQIWDDSGIADPVITGNTLVVTAQDGTTKATYTVTVNAALSSDATVTSATYTVSALSGGAGTITNVPGGTTKADFEAGLAKHQANQAWDDSGIADPVVTGNTLVVTAQDGTTKANYTVTVNAALSSDATVTSAIYTVSTLSGGAGTITNVPGGTTKADFEAGLAKHQASQIWDDSGIADPVVTGNTLLVTAQDGKTKATYAVTVNITSPTVLSAVTNAAGNIITITFSKTMADPTGDQSQFNYEINGGDDQSFVMVTLHSLDSAKIDLTANGMAIAPDNVVTLKYTAGSVVANDGGVLASFIGLAVTNNMPVAAPTVTSILPTSGPITGGTSVFISGTGFANGATVTIGGTAATGVSVINATSITATTPPGEVGTGDVVVTDPSNQSSIMANAFTYVVPALAGQTVVSQFVTGNGIFTQAITASSDDTAVELTIAQGIQGFVNGAKPLSFISIDPMIAPPSPPPSDSAIGLAYDVGPEGATFNKPVFLTFHFDPHQLPVGANNNNLTIAVWDVTSKNWIGIPSVVDTVAHTITAQVTHFSDYVVLVPNSPAAFTISNLTVSPPNINTGTAVTISTLVTNNGDLSGDYQVFLKINGIQVDTKDITVLGNTSQTVTFVTSTKDKGIYVIDVNGELSSYTVKATSESTSVKWTLIGGIAGFVVGLCLAVLLATVHDRSKSPSRRP